MHFVASPPQLPKFKKYVIELYLIKKVDSEPRKLSGIS